MKAEMLQRNTNIGFFRIFFLIPCPPPFPNLFLGIYLTSPPPNWGKNRCNLDTALVYKFWTIFDDVLKTYPYSVFTDYWVLLKLKSRCCGHQTTFLAKKSSTSTPFSLHIINIQYTVRTTAWKQSLKYFSHSTVRDYAVTPPMHQSNVLVSLWCIFSQLGLIL